MGLDWHRLVEERNVWVAYNFPTEVDGKVGLGSTLGVIEELGELSHAHLKEDQGIRGTAEEHQANARDAIGDLTVYLLGLMSLWGPPLPPSPVWAVTGDNSTDCLLHLADHVGSVADGFRRGEWSLGRYTIGWCVHWMQQYCAHRQWDYDQIVQDTWDGVKQRDWIKYPDTGLPPVEESV